MASFLLATMIASIHVHRTMERRNEPGVDGSKGFTGNESVTRTELVPFVELRDHLDDVHLMRFCQFGIDGNGHYLFCRAFRQGK